MDETFSFQLTALDVQHLRPQVSRALEKRTELISRQKYPKMWELTDRLNSVEKAPQAVRENRRKRRTFLGLWSWLLGALLLPTGLLEPRTMLLPLLLGAVCWGNGVSILWRNRRALLGILSLVMGGVLCVSAAGNYTGLGPLLLPGIVHVTIGGVALLTRKRESDPFGMAAEQLLVERNARPGLEELHLTFSREGMIVSQVGNGEEPSVAPYASFECVLETEELLLPIYQDAVTIVQKKDLLTGTLAELREFLSGQTRYVAV